MAFLHIRIPDELEGAIKDRAHDLGFENPSQYVRNVLRKEVERECKCPNGCSAVGIGLVDNVCQRCGSLGV
jgi:hypothetical protein